MTDRPPVHADANEAALRHLANRHHDAELQWAIAVGNVAWKETVARQYRQRIDELETKCETLDFDFIDDALKRRKDERAAGQREALAQLRDAIGIRFET